MNIVFAALVLMVMKEDISNKEKVKYYILIGVTLSLLFFTNQRTPMLGAIAQIVYLFVISVIQLIKSNKSVKISQYLKRGIIIAAMMTCCFVTVFLCITTVKTCIANILPEMQFVSTEAGIYKADEVEESVKLSESFGHAEDRFTKGIGQSMDNFTSGRIGIWKNYIDNIEVIGHAKEERQIVSGDRKYASTNAHNVYLQISYSAGIAAGIAVLLIMLVLAKDILSRLKSFILNKEKIDNAFIFVSCIAISFAVFSITSAGYMMYTYIHATYFWITLYYFTMKPEGE